MALTPVNLSASALDAECYPFQINTTGLKEGAVVMKDTSVAKGAAKAPTGAAVAGIVGVIADVLPSTGTTSGLDYNIQTSGDGVGLLDATVSVTVGDYLVAADTDGSLRAYNDGVDDNCDIVGISKVTRTAGAANELIPITIRIQRIDKT